MENNTIHINALESPSAPIERIFNGKCQPVDKIEVKFFEKIRIAQILVPEKVFTPEEKQILVP